jgi:tRNA-specific 2-thiouridylase
MHIFDGCLSDKGPDIRKTTVMVAMSGGVDSSVAAALLVEEGYRVLGATMRLWCLAPDDRGPVSCRSAQSLEDARSVCRTLGIPHYVIDLSAEFERKIVEPFCREYLAGRTPNPCVACNTRVKFGDLLRRARSMGADLMATGHHVRLGLDPETGRFLLKKGLDHAKDQSYALWGLTQPVLGRVVFPVGLLTKAQVRERARALSLPVADKPESQDVCFMPQGDIAGLFERVVPRVRDIGRGEIRGVNGETLGFHEGYFRFTVGQRRGLGVAAGRPQYVTHVDPEENVVYLGDEDDLKARVACARDFSYVDGAPPVSGPSSARSAQRTVHRGASGRGGSDEPADVADSTASAASSRGAGPKGASTAEPREGRFAPSSADQGDYPGAESPVNREARGAKESVAEERIAGLTAKIRYLHPGAPGTLEITGERDVRFIFDRAQRAITPGQSLVVYEGERLIGGGVIDGAER